MYQSNLSLRLHSLLASVLFLWLIVVIVTAGFLLLRDVEQEPSKSKKLAVDQICQTVAAEYPGAQLDWIHYTVGDVEVLFRLDSRNRRIRISGDGGFHEDKLSQFMQTTRDLHTQLLLDKALGRTLLGILGLLLLLLIIAGVISWLLRYKPASIWQLGHSQKSLRGKVLLLHLVFGAFLAPWFMMFAASGILFCFSDRLKSVFTKTDLQQVLEQKQNVGIGKSKSIDEIQTSLENTYSQYQVSWIKLPSANENVVEFLMQERLKPRGQFFFRVITSRNSGMVLSDSAKDGSEIYERFLAFMRELHYGTIFGLYSRCIWLFVVIMFVLMIVSGAVMKRRPRVDS